MSYVLATYGNHVRWYRFEMSSRLREGAFTLEAELDLGVVPVFANKDDAKRAAQALGLTTWRYVRI
ncbi:MAG: hypothetical protein ABIZ18_09370 [Caldimonas sp.]